MLKKTYICDDSQSSTGALKEPFIMISNWCYGCLFAMNIKDNIIL